MNSSPSNSLNIKTIDSIVELEAIKDDWDQLHRQQVQKRQTPSGSDVFLSYGWQHHWLSLREADLLGADIGKPCLLILSQNKAIVAIAPFCLKKKRGLTFLEWNGQPATQYGDILLGDLSIDAAMTAIDAFVKQSLKPDFLALRKTHESANIYSYLAQHGMATNEMKAPFIDLSSFTSFDEYFARFSQRGRKSRRRHRRKMAEHGALSFAMLGPSPEAYETIHIALKQKRAWLQKHAIISKGLAGKDLDHFFAAASKTTGVPTGLLVSQLKSGDKIVAVEIGFAQNNCYVAHFGTYDLAYEQHGPGALQMEDTIAALIEKNIQHLDLLAPDDGYKRQWTDTALNVRDFALPLSLKGRAYVALWLKTLRPSIIKSVHALPPAIKTKLSKFI